MKQEMLPGAEETGWKNLNFMSGSIARAFRAIPSWSHDWQCCQNLLYLEIKLQDTRRHFSKCQETEWGNLVENAEDVSHLQKCSLQGLMCPR